MKKYLAMLLAAVLLLCGAPLAGFTAVDRPERRSGALFPSAKAAEIVRSGSCGEIDNEKGLDGSQVKWTLDSDGLLTISGSGAMRDYEFSRTKSPWNGSEDVTAIVIQDGVTSVAKWAFHNCGNLTGATLGKDVTRIGQSSFSDCPKLAEAAIPEGVEEIGDNAFNGCSALRAATIPGSVKRIGGYAFTKCDSLATVTIGNGVEQIGRGAFEAYAAIEKIVIPESVTEIEDMAFSCGSELAELTVSDGNPVYYSAGNCVIRRKDGVLVCGCNTSVIPNDGSITKIGDAAFMGCGKLKAAAVPEGVTRIDDHAFYGCAGMTSVTLPDSLQYISHRAFAGCAGLTALELPGNLMTIAMEVFSGCTGLTAVRIPRSVWQIGNDAFIGCDGLTEMTVDEENPVYCAAGNCLIHKQTKTLVSGCKTSRIPADGSVTVIGPYAFAENKGLTDLNIPDSVTEIRNNAFENCAGLANVTIGKGLESIRTDAFKGCAALTGVILPDSVKSIESDAFAESGLTHIAIPAGVTDIENSVFAGCAELVSVTIPNSVKSMGEGVFMSCAKLTDITLPDSIESIGGNTFRECASLEKIALPKSLTTISSFLLGECENLSEVTIPDGVTTIGGGAFRECPSLTHVTIPASVKEISSAFYGCTGLTEAILPDGLTTLGDYAFYSCTGLKEVTIPDSVTKIGNRVFEGCTAIQTLTVGKPIGQYTLTQMSMPKDALSAVILTDGVTDVKEDAFSGCKSLTGITIPGGVSQIGKSAFQYCGKLETVTVSGDNSVYESRDNCLIHRETGTLILGCKNSVIPTDGSVKAIGESAFHGCAALESVTIPDGVTEIGDNAFFGCTGLKTVQIPDSVTRVGNAAFSGCTGLARVTLPDGVTEIGHSAFYECTGLTEMVIPAGVTTLSSLTFFGCTGLKEITIPNGVTSTGMDVFHGCTGLTRVTIPDSMTKIGNFTFCGCTGLTEIVIPDSVTDLGRYTFDGCAGLKSVTIGNQVTSIGYYTFCGCKSLESITIPDSVTEIVSYAFEHCSSLKAVTIPDSVTSIGLRAFGYCTGLSSIIIPSSVTKFWDHAVPEHTVIYGYADSHAQQWAKENNRAFIVIGEAAVTLNAPEVVNEPTVNVNGFANPGADVVCSVNGKETVTVSAEANGRWSAALPLPGAMEGDCFTVKAAVTAEGKTAETTAAVTYKPDAIVFREFTLDHGRYSVTVTGERLGFSVPNVTYIPGNPSAFRVKVSNDDRIGKLFVVSTKDGVSKQMELTYDKESGYWLAEGFFDKTDKNYVPGVFTITGADKDGREFDTGVTIQIRFLIDPSGYAYEAVKSNVLEGVTAAVCYKDEAGHELLWNAETAGQLNPVTTLADGAFAWVVPEGQWQVRLTKDGYEEARSEWMDVPPERTNVYIPMVSKNAPEVSYLNVYADRAEIVFSQYMDMDSVNTDNVKFDGHTGTIKPIDKTETAEGSGVFYAKAFTFTPEKAFAGEVSVAVSGVKNYADITMESPCDAVCTVAAEPKNLTATKDVTVAYGKTAEITVSAENAAGKTLSVSCDSANVTLSAKSLTLDETGKAVLTATGDMPGAANLTFALDGTALTATAKVAVEVPGVSTEPDQPAEPEKPAYTPGDVNNDGKVGSDDARLALRASVQLEHYVPGTAPFLAADYNKDGAVKSDDARCILRVSVGLDPFG